MVVGLDFDRPGEEDASQVAGAHVLCQGLHEAMDHQLVQRSRRPRHQQHAIQQLLAAAVVGEGVEIADGVSRDDEGQAIDYGLGGGRRDWGSTMVDGCGRGTVVILAQGEARTSHGSKNSSPTLLLTGDHDFIPAEISEHIAGAMPRARLVVLKGRGHFAYMECAGDVRSALVEFFRRAEGSERQH